MMRNDLAYQNVRLSRTVYSTDPYHRDQMVWTFEVSIMDVDENRALARASLLLSRALVAVDVLPIETERIP